MRKNLIITVKGIVATLIDRVEVGQAQVVDGVKKQEIKIIYNFIGNIQE